MSEDSYTYQNYSDSFDTPTNSTTPEEIPPQNHAVTHLTPFSSFPHNQNNTYDITKSQIFNSNKNNNNNYYNNPIINQSKNTYSSIQRGKR